MHTFALIYVHVCASFCIKNCANFVQKEESTIFKQNSLALKSMVAYTERHKVRRDSIQNLNIVWSCDIREYLSMEGMTQLLHNKVKT